jgi:transcriptional regulator with XRE-family HTH domain
MAIEKVTIPVARKRKNMTQENLAEYCGVSVATVSNWENFRTEITVSQARKVAEAVGLHYDEIIFLPEDTV